LSELVKILFWISLSILFYCYFGYGILLLVINKVKHLFTKKIPVTVSEQNLPAVTLIITAFNEEEVLQKKIENCLSLNYPRPLITIIVNTDGSSDGSGNIIKKYPEIVHLHSEIRKGKSAAVKRAMQFVKTPYVIFSDANTMLNAGSIKKIIPHFSNLKTGGVAGEKKIVYSNNTSVVGNAEGLYWKYESFMKKLNAEFNTVTGAAGELFAIRTELFADFPDEIVLDDFIISMQLCLQGFTIKYEPGAFAEETPSASLADEQKRKTRISAGAYQSIGYLKECINIFKHPALSFQYISGRLLRWTFCPIAIILLLVTNVFLVAGGGLHIFYSYILILQILFYAAAFTGWVFMINKKKVILINIPFYFLFMNYCLIKGFFRFITKKQTVLWEKSVRQTI
jgi:poly-beta-1,6-N-acetyl-D-glucosamine synthase